MKKLEDRKSGGLSGTAIFQSIVVSFLFVLLFSYSTSPLYDYKEKVVDSYIFQTIGKYWNDGVIPYIGLFDHKGPIIFFINALGYALTGNRYGIFILQVISLSFTIMIMLKMYCQEFSWKKAWIITGVSLIGYLAGYTGGNLTEEYILPFLMLAFYFWKKWNDEVLLNLQEMYHKPTIALLYGAIIGIAVMTRVTNAIGVCFIVLFVTIFLIRYHKWKNLWENILMFCIGIAVIIIPFTIYFTIHDSMYDMWFGTIGMNVSYMENSKSFFENLSFKKIIIFAMYFFSCYSMLFAGILLLRNKKRRILSIFMIVTSCITCIMYMRGRAYSHYCMVCLPYFVISVLELKKMENEKSLSYRSVFLKRVIVLFSFFYMIGGVWSVKTIYDDVVEMKIDNSVGDLMDYVPMEERNSFIAWQCPTYLYLKYDIVPYYRYFILQNSQTKISEQLKNEVVEMFQYGDVKWIMVADGHQKTIKKILDDRYVCVKSKMGEKRKYLLYHLKEGNID